MSETPETNMATSHKDPRSVAPLLATIADFARLQESCNAQDASVVAMSEKVRRLERQRDELAAALRELYLIADTIRRAHWMHWQSEETYKLTASINRARAICDAIGARLGEGGEG